MANVLKFKQTHVPRHQAELARLKVLQGPDYGSVFVLTAGHASIGRGDENDIVLSDLKASRRHALVAFAKGGWEISDAGSSNGILHNGKATPKSVLRTNDTVTVGETTLEFLGSEAGTKQLLAPPSLSGKERSAIAALPGQAGKQGKGARGLLKDPKLMLAAAAAVLFVVFFQDEAPRQPKTAMPPPPAPAARDLASYLPGSAGTATNKTAENFFKAGFREYRERNYLRARVHFETALQLAPGHLLSSMYMENCKKAIAEEIKFHLEQGKKNFDAGKLRSAKGHFEAVMRLLYREPGSPAYVEARDQLDKVSKEMRGGVG